MVQASRAGLRRRLLLHLALVFAHFYVCGSIHLSPDTHKLLNVAAAIPLRYKQIVDELQQLPMPLPAISSSKFSLSSLTPFCAKFTVPEIEANVVPECIRWEEQELDMLLMYLDLIASGMNDDLAKGFYEEVRCLSRANINPAPQQNIWEVCFSYDYSEMVGDLLSQYINKDFNLLQSSLDTSERTGVNSTTRFFSASSAAGRRPTYFMSMFGDGRNFRMYSSREEQLMEKSCCETCASTRYFVNVQKNECLKNPFGKHCCHVACKSLGRLKVGVSSSIAYCCPRCRPQACKA